MPAELTEDQMNKLVEWLNQMEINSRNLPKDFSDGVLMARILNQLFPRIVEMHNYSKVCSFQRKLANWETLNLKVFRRLNVHRSQAVLRDLANATPGVIESLLYRIMKAEQDGVYLKSNTEETDAVCDVLSSPRDVLVITLNRKIGDALIQIPQKVILFSEYKRLVKEEEELRAVVFELEAEVAKQEAVIAEKDAEIDEIQKRLAKLIATNKRNELTISRITR